MKNVKTVFLFFFAAVAAFAGVAFAAPDYEFGPDTGSTSGKYGKFSAGILNLDQNFDSSYLVTDTALGNSFRESEELNTSGQLFQLGYKVSTNNAEFSIAYGTNISVDSERRYESTFQGCATPNCGGNGANINKFDAEGKLKLNSFQFSEALVDVGILGGYSYTSTDVDGFSHGSNDVTMDSESSEVFAGVFFNTNISQRLSFDASASGFLGTAERNTRLEANSGYPLVTTTAVEQDVVGMRLGVGVTYNITENLSLSGTVTHSLSVSNDAGCDFKSNIFADGQFKTSDCSGDYGMTTAGASLNYTF